MHKISPLYQLLFWVFVFFFVYDVVVYEYELLPAIIFSFIEVLVYAIIFYLNLFVLIPKILKKNGVGYYWIGLLLFLIILISICLLFEFQYHFADNSLRFIFSASLNYTLFIVISFLYWYFTLYQQEKNNRLSLQNEKLQAELMLLKSQVSPHFLFNSLNNIYSLSVIKHDNAPIMIEKLSDILRYIIYEGKNRKVHLEREVELINNYIDLQLLKKLKAEKNIKVVINGVSSSHKIAPLILINMVENCFKHSDIAYNKNGFLDIHLSIENERLHFSTTNSYMKSSKKSGIGLKNIEQQLKHYYPDTHNLTSESNEDIFKVELEINLYENL